MVKNHSLRLALARSAVLLAGVLPAHALDFQRANEALDRASNGSGYHPELPDIPPMREAEAGAFPDGAGYRSSMLEYRIEAPVEDVWRLYTTTPLRLLLPSAWSQPTLRPYRVSCPGRSRDFPAEEVWPALQRGLQIQSFLHWGLTNIHQDLDVTEAEAFRRISFRYAERGPAEGDQMIEFIVGSAAGSRPVVLITHSSHYRGKNPLYSALYGFVHRTLLDSWHLGAKYYLESRLWARANCSQAEGRADPTFESLFEKARDGSGRQPPRRAFKRALCLYSQRFLGAASEIPKDEEQLSRWAGSLAAALASDEAAALDSFRRQAEADRRAAEAGAAACRP